MNLSQRIKAFDLLGTWINNYFSNNQEDDSYKELDEVILKAKAKNQWFLPENIKKSLSAWGLLLNTGNLTKWTESYDFSDTAEKRVGIIMAGNIPLVGFHDFLSVLISGHIAIVKTSSDDSQLLPFIVKKLISFAPELEGQIQIVDRLEDQDAVIATGSNNTARYFEAYFGKKPNIIRKNRNSVAIINGNESDKELQLLANDIFDYFGMGCRSITKLYLPEGYDLDKIFKNLLAHSDIVHHNKYGNNYDYYRAIYLMNKEAFLENGFVAMREHKNIGSPVGVLHYSFYNDMKEVKEELEEQMENIQCIVAKDNIFEHQVKFGETQSPGLADYADHVDTLDFLSKL